MAAIQLCQHELWSDLHRHTHKTFNCQKKSLSRAPLCLMCSTLILPFGDICCCVNYTPPGALINTHTNMCTRTNTLCTQFRWSELRRRLSGAGQYGRSRANEAFIDSGVIIELPMVKTSSTPLMNKPSLKCRGTRGPGVASVPCLVIHYTASSSHPAQAFVSTAVQALANASGVRQTAILTHKQLTPEYFHWPSSLPAISPHYSLLLSAAIKTRKSLKKQEQQTQLFVCLAHLKLLWGSTNGECCDTACFSPSWCVDPCQEQSNGLQGDRQAPVFLSL